MQAQYKFATIVETAYVKASGPTPNYGFITNTGSDIIITQVNGINFELSVSVWDGDFPSMGWKLIENGTTFSDIYDLPFDVFDPDVCILQKDNAWFALISYMVGNPGVPRLLVLQLNTITKLWSQYGLYNLGNNQTVFSAINIDSDQHDHYFVVWDQLNSQNQTKIFGAAGAYNGNGGLTLCMTNYEFPTFFDPTGSSQINFPYNWPDVAVMDLPINNNNPGQVKVSFIGGTSNAYPNSTHVLGVTDELRFTKFGICTYTNPSANLAYAKPELSGQTFDNPRIARNRRNGNYNNIQEGYTVVYARIASGLNDICGTTVFYDYVTNAPNLNIITTENVYTDGSSNFYGGGGTLPQINQYENRNPVVSYERKSGADDPNVNQNMVIAFEHRNINVLGAPLAFYAHNSNGKPYTTSIPFNYSFYVVPAYTQMPLGMALSVAGEQSDKFLYTFTNYNLATVNYKVVTSMADLKQSIGIFGNNHYPTIILSDYAIPDLVNNMAGNLVWVDLQGRNLASDKEGFLQKIASIPTGITYLRFTDKSGISNCVKLLKL